ncbi:hypothetical protein KSC_027340 [Ktedonobacter sp. SOSP1-52]|nr:hypothetical protein KSC_027340 [Ktedonobacter sp. SOSP1-52]
MFWIAAGNLENHHLPLEIEGREVRWDSRIPLMADDVVHLGRSRIAIANPVNERATPAQHQRSGEGEEQRTQHPQPKRQEPVPSLTL